MHEPINTCELGEVRLRLRHDLDFTRQQYGGQTCYVVHEPTGDRFYRIGIPEYTFLSLLDGRTTLHQAIAQTAGVLGANAFSEREAAAIAKWLIDCQLATTEQSVDASRLLDVSDRAARQARWQWINPIFIKVPLGNPEPLIERLAPWLGWLTGSGVLVVWVTVCCIALHQLAGRWGELSLAGNLVLSRGNWLWLGVTWLVLKLLHELFHALMCRRFGGSVREAGLMFILFGPIPYVDVTSAWRFPSKWQRIATSAAGMYIELLVAAIAAIVWCHTDSALMRHHAYHIMLLAGLTTVLFNANFLMRFDGYYILADLLEIPNLYTLGQQYLTYVGRRYVLGIPATPPRWPAYKAATVKLYGVASLAWRVLVCVGLVVAAGLLFSGAGVALAVLSVLLWLGFPLVRFAKFLVKGNLQERPRPVRFALVMAAAATGIVLLFTSVPWPGRVSAPAIVRYASPCPVRTETRGFVEQIHVRSGQHVQRGDLLVTMTNLQLELERQDLELAIAESRLKSRRYHRQGNVAAYQAELASQAALDSRLNQKQQESDTLIVRAPTGGQIVTAELDSLTGRYVTPGTTLMLIADEATKELVVSIAQQESRHFLAWTGKPLSAFIPASQTSGLTCRLDQVEPRATTEVLVPEQAALHGGELDVKQTRGSDRSGAPVWSHLQPQFTGRVALSASQSRTVHAGQRGEVLLSTRRGTVGQVLMSQARTWLRHRIEAAR